MKSPKESLTTRPANGAPCSPRRRINRPQDDEGPDGEPEDKAGVVAAGEHADHEKSHARDREPDFRKDREKIGHKEFVHGPLSYSAAWASTLAPAVRSTRFSTETCMTSRKGSGQKPMTSTAAISGTK